MRRKQGCKDYAELRSAYVDGGLKPVDVDRLTAHLGICPACVRDIAELRRVRALLSTGRTAHPERPPDALAARLVNIAGLDAGAPIWSRPFRRVRRGALPSSRRHRRRRTAAGAAFLPGSERCDCAGLGGRGGAAGRDGAGGLGGEAGVMLRPAMSALGGKEGEVGDLDLSAITAGQ